MQISTKHEDVQAPFFFVTIQQLVRIIDMGGWRTKLIGKQSLTVVSPFFGEMGWGGVSTNMEA